MSLPLRVVVALLPLACAVLLCGACAAPAQPAGISPEAAGLTWRECQPASSDEEWRQVEACLGHPAVVWDDADRANAGERTERGYRLQIGADTFETREFPTPIPNLSLYVLTRNGQLAKAYLGRFTTYSPDLGLYALAGSVVWAFDDGRVSTVFYGGEDLRAAYGADAVYAPYALGGSLIVVARRGSAYSVLYNGQQVGPTFDAITIAYCCEPVMYSARGGGGRYVFWGERDGARHVAEIGALGVSTLGTEESRSGALDATATPAPPSPRETLQPTTTPATASEPPRQTLRIVFSAKNDSSVDLFSMNPDGSDVRRLSRGPGLLGEPACSPDGRRIAFSAWRDDGHHLYVMDVDGSGEAQLTAGPGNQFSPAWSPDGQRIIYVSEADDAFFIMNADGSSKTRLPITGPNLSAPAWSPVGQRLAYVSGQGGLWEIHVANLDGSDDVNLTRGAGYDQHPAWSPDGKQIAFSSSGRHAGYATEIYVITADALGRFGSDSALRRLTFTLDDRSGRNNYAPAWSPDGKQIAFTSDRDGDGVWVMNVDGSGQVRLADPQLEATSPCWLPIVTATNAIPLGWQQITGRYVTFRVPKSWSPTEVEPFGGGILEDWRLGIPGLESDQGLGFSSVDFEQLRPSDAISQVAFTLGGKAGVKYLRSGENGVSYDYHTVGHDDQGSFGIHVSAARFNPELERDLDRLARSVVFRLGEPP